MKIKRNSGFMVGVTRSEFENVKTELAVLEEKAANKDDVTAMRGDLNLVRQDVNALKWIAGASFVALLSFIVAVATHLL